MKEKTKETAISMALNAQDCGHWTVDAEDTPGKLATCLETIALCFQEAAIALRAGKSGEIQFTDEHRTLIAWIGIENSTAARIPRLKTFTMDKHGAVKATPKTAGAGQ